MVAVEHVLDLENTVNFDRHTSVLAPYCNCWEAPSAKSDPGSSQAASRGVESPPKSRFEWPYRPPRTKMEAPHVINGLFALALPKVPDRGSEHRPLPHPCRKAVSLSISRPSQTVKLAKTD